MKSFTEYLNEASLNEASLNEASLNEASLNRYMQHVTNGDAIAIVTASRSEESPAVNNRNNKQLRAYVRMAGFGFVKAEGHYQETVKKGGETEIVDAKDDSTIIFAEPGRAQELRKLAVSLGKKFNQESVFFSFKGKSILIYTRNSYDGEFHVGDVASLGSIHIQQSRLPEVFTRMKGKNFSLDWIGKEEIEPLNPHAQNEAISLCRFRQVISEQDDPILFWESMKKETIEEWEKRMGIA